LYLLETLFKKKSNMKKSLIYLIVVAFASHSCKSPIDNIGPDLCPTAYFVYDINELVVDGLNENSEVDLELNGLNIKAQFTEVVEWTLRIVSDDANKTYTGKTDSINLRWFGNAETFPLFKAGDARIELDIACLEQKTKTFKITKDPNFKNLHSSYGVLIRDYDKNGFAPVAGETYSTADGWAGVNGDTSHYEYFSENPSELGGLYGELYAKVENSTWYHGATSFPIVGFSGKISTSNADSVYVNFFCKGYGLENTGMEFALRVGVTSFFHTEPLTWEGWKFISVKLSDLKILSGSRAGEKFVDVDGISGCVLQLGSAPEKTAEAKSAYDFIILTVGEPFLVNN
jgi:hypothetical protein